MERCTSAGASCSRPMTFTLTPWAMSSSVFSRTAPSMSPNSPLTSSSVRRQFSWLNT
jgi:hypothetical protein